MRFLKNTAWPCITVIVACLSWVLVNGDKVVQNIQSFQSWYGSSKALEGRWDNSTEYDIDPPEWLTKQEDGVQIWITIKNSILDGAIMSGKLSKIFPFEYVLLTGEKRGLRDTLDAYAFDYILGKKTYFGSFTIHREGERLIVDADETAQQFFPKRSILLKKSDIAFPALEEQKLNQNKSENDEQPPLRIPKPDHVNGQ